MLNVFGAKITKCFKSDFPKFPRAGKRMYGNGKSYCRMKGVASIRGASVKSLNFTSPQQLPRNNHLLNFRRPFIDLCDLGVTHHTFNMIFFHITVATMNLYGLRCNILSDL